MDVQSKNSDNFQAVDLGVDKHREILKNKIQDKSWSEAKSLVEGHIAFYQSDVDYLMDAAEVFTHTNDFPSALKTYHSVLDELDNKDPKLFEVYKNMGNIYLKCGDVEAAEEKYHLAHAINNEDEALTVNYGVLAIQRGHYEEAKAKFAHVVGVNPSSDLGWVGLALVHRAHGDLELSRACLLRALDENAFNKIAITNYYQWCFADGVDSTNSYIKDYISKYPNDSEVNKLAMGISQ